MFAGLSSLLAAEGLRIPLLRLQVEVTAGFSPEQLQIYSFCEMALHGPGHASPRSVKITSATATCYRLDGMGPGITRFQEECEQSELVS